MCRDGDDADDVDDDDDDDDVDGDADFVSLQSTEVHSRRK